MFDINFFWVLVFLLSVRRSNVYLSTLPKPGLFSTRPVLVLKKKRSIVRLYSVFLYHVYYCGYLISQLAFFFTFKFLSFSFLDV